MSPLGFGSIKDIAKAIKGPAWFLAITVGLAVAWKLIVG